MKINSLSLKSRLQLLTVVSALALAGILMALIIVPVIGSVLVVGRYLYCKILDIDPWPDAAETSEGAPVNSNTENQFKL